MRDDEWHREIKATINRPEAICFVRASKGIYIFTEHNTMKRDLCMRSPHRNDQIFSLSQYGH